MRHRSLVLSLVLSLLGFVVAHAQISSSKPISLPHHSPSTPQGLEGGFWRTDQNFDPILRMKNVLLKQSLSVTPVLYFADGTEYDLPVMTLEPAGVAQVNIRLALENVPASIQSHVSAYGMAGISYKWSWPAIIATIQNTDEIASLTITTSLRADIRKTHATPEAAEAQAIHGTWWLPTPKADGFVVLANSSLTPKRVAVQFSGNAGNSIAQQTIQLPPHGSSMIQLSSALGSTFGGETAGGIEIHYSGPESGVIAYTGITDETTGFSASPHLYEDHLDPARPVHQVTLSAPGLLLGKADPSMQFPSETYFKPYAVLHNLSAQSRQIALALTSAPAGGTPQDVPVGTVTLAPGQTAQLDLASQFSQSNPLPDGYGHLSATFNGQDGDVHMETGSTDQSGSYVFEVTPTQQVESASRTLCFWSIEGDNDSMIAVWNYKLTAQDLVLTLYYSGGQYRIPFHLEARRAYNLDMLSLVRSRVADPDGNLIPDNITSGSAILSGPGGEADKISIAVAASVFNVRNATCGQQCVTCNGAAETGFNPTSYAMPVQGIQNAQFQITWNSGTVYTNPSGTSWHIQNSSIATINSGGTITGQSAGLTNASAVTSLYPVYATVCSEGNAAPCPQAPLQGQGNADVASLSCMSVTRAQTTTCTVSAATGATFSGWKFVDAAGNTVTSNSTGSQWSGTAVQSGTVSVKVAGSDGSNSTPSASMTVNARSGFTFNAVNSAQVQANSITCYDGTTHNLPSPPIPNGDEGYYCADLAFSFNFATVSDNGPNNGYEYVTSASAASGSNPTKFNYIVVSDLLSGSTFYNAQCGNYSSSNPSGFIAGSQLKQNVFDHEGGAVLSHWTEYVAAQNNSSNNVGTVLEATTAPPGSTGNSFAQNAGNAALTRITQASEAEPCGGTVNHDSSQSCASCGAINFSPYASCTGQPVAYCH
ncbi:MAG TPA: hypothetical protein VK578_08595 [Edaphobacter sp.]|nr:hypothetical protein [Edaphobacter sp.]